MSHAYNNNKKTKRRRLQQYIVNMECGEEPAAYLQTKYPGKDTKYILVACKAEWDYRGVIKRMIRAGKIARYVLAKDGKGRPLFRSWKRCKGVYLFSKSKERIVVGQHLIQKFVGHEMLKQAKETPRATQLE